MSTGIYLFCLTPETTLPELKGTGIDGLHPLLTEAIGDVAAIFSEVALEDFAGPEAQDRMEDLTWIGPRALRHEEVIMDVMEVGPVLPVRFGTVFSSLDAMKEPLRRHRAILSEFFRETAGKKEWAFRGYVNMPQARAQVLAERLAAEKEQLAGLTPGKRYFLEQRIKDAVNKEMASRLKGLGNQIVTSLQDLSAAFHERRLLAKEVTGREEEMFFHGAFLVRDASMEDMQRLLSDWNAAHQDAGLLLELSGPWPPYHFAPVL